jgi:hypothetical protein
VLVEKQENHCLVAVCDKIVDFRSDENWFQFNLSMVEEPCQVSISVFMFVELLKLIAKFFHLFGKSAWKLKIFLRPVAISKHIRDKFDTLTLNFLSSFGRLELVH